MDVWSTFSHRSIMTSHMIQACICLPFLMNPLVQVSGQKCRDFPHCQEPGFVGHEGRLLPTPGHGNPRYSTLTGVNITLQAAIIFQGTKKSFSSPHWYTEYTNYTLFEAPLRATPPRPHRTSCSEIHAQPFLADQQAGLRSPRKPNRPYDLLKSCVQPPLARYPASQRWRHGSRVHRR